METSGMALLAPIFDMKVLDKRLKLGTDDL